jgi:Putative lumazine-binding
MTFTPNTARLARSTSLNYHPAKRGRAACAAAVGGMFMLLGSLAHAISSEQAAALASFQGLLDGLGKRDKSAMMAQVLPGASGTFVRDGKPKQMTIEALADNIAKPGSDTYEERIRDPLVRVDGDIAVIWAPFQFLLNGKIDHCGTDIATLVLAEGRWLITSIEDNHRQECGTKKF